MRKSTKVAIGLVGVALIIGIVSLCTPLPLRMGYIGLAFLSIGTIVGLFGLFSRSKEQANGKEQ